MRPKARSTFERRLDILIFAAHATKDFTVRDVYECVVDATALRIRNCLSDLVDSGYLEKTSIYSYQATGKTKQLFGVQPCKTTT